MVKMQWGMPPPPRTGGPTTDIRNTPSPHWRIWQKPENRCLVPANSFAEYAPEPNPRDQEKGRGVVRAQRGSAPIRVRGHLDRVQGG
jgi:putative SOS response-associated peptidase YedK